MACEFESRLGHQESNVQQIKKGVIVATIHIKEGQFENEVLKAKEPVIVDFYADWCGPCKIMEPIFDQLSIKYEGKIKFAKLDVDKYQSVAIEYGVMSIPTLIIFKDGKSIDNMMGLQDESSLSKKLDLL